MAISFSCQGCGQPIAVPEALAGKSGKCPQCGMVVEIPGSPVAGPLTSAAPMMPTHPVGDGAADPGPMRGCPSCAEPIPASSAACPVCGEPLMQPPAAHAGVAVGSVVALAQRRTLDVGPVILQSARTLAARFFTLWGIHLVGALPAFAFHVELASRIDALGPHPRPEELLKLMSECAGLVAVAWPILVIVGQVGMGAIIHAVLMDRTHQRVGLPSAIGAGIRALPRMFAAIFLVGLLAVPALLMCCIPVLYVLVTMLVVAPVVVAERLGPIASLRRSAQLTVGHKWMIFAILLLISAVSGTVGMGFGVIELIVKRSSDLGIVPKTAGFVIQSVIATFTTVAVTTIYLELRSIEGSGITAPPAP